MESYYLILMKMENEQTKKSNWKDKIRMPVLIVLTLIPLITLFQNYYSMSFPMLNLWELFVEQIFGSFWVAVLFIMLIFFIILMLGGISFYTVLIFMIYFITAMAIGYGYPLITLGVATFGTLYCIFQIIRWMENR
jgi:hypothetical protein